MKSVKVVFGVLALLAFGILTLNLMDHTSMGVRNETQTLVVGGGDYVRLDANGKRIEGDGIDRSGRIGLYCLDFLLLASGIALFMSPTAARPKCAEPPPDGCR